VDAHNEAVQSFINTHPFFIRLNNWLLGVADLTIVTNAALAEIVRRSDGNPIVLPDRIPAVHAVGNYHKGIIPRAVLISTFAKDEPIELFLEAIDLLDDEIELFVTGNPENFPEQTRARYANLVTFTGFLPENEYWGLLNSADFVADLTLMDNCLVCGAYEAVALGKPAMLSDNQATRDLFSKGVVYVDNTVQGIMTGISTMLEQRLFLEKDVIALREKLLSEWDTQASALQEKLVMLME